MAERLPFDIVMAVDAFFRRALSLNPHRVGKQLHLGLQGIYSARVGTTFRILYRIDEENHRIQVVNILHRSVAYREQ